MKLYTVTEIGERRYNSSVLRLLTTILSLLALIGILASQVTSAGSVIASLGFGSLTTCSIIVAAFFIGFTAFGGMWAVTVTDFVQIAAAGLRSWKRSQQPIRRTTTITSSREPSRPMSSG